MGVWGGRTQNGSVGAFAGRIKVCLVIAFGITFNGKTASFVACGLYFRPVAVVCCRKRCFIVVVINNLSVAVNKGKP